MNIYWSHVPGQGVPRKLYWPVKVVSWEEVGRRKVEVLCKTDCAIIGVSKDQMIPFPGPFDNLKQQGIETLKRKRLFSQLKAFELDIEWALKECSSNDTEEEIVVEDASGKACVVSEASYEKSEMSVDKDDNTDDRKDTDYHPHKNQVLSEADVMENVFTKAFTSEDNSEFAVAKDGNTDDSGIQKDPGYHTHKNQSLSETDDVTENVSRHAFTSEGSTEFAVDEDDNTDGSGIQKDLGYHTHKNQALSETDDVTENVSRNACVSNDESEMEVDKDGDTDDSWKDSDYDLQKDQEAEDVAENLSRKACESDDESEKAADMDDDTDDSWKDPDYHQHEDQAESDEYVTNSDGDSDTSYVWPHLKDLMENPQGANCASRKPLPDDSTDTIIRDVNFGDIYIRKITYAGTYNAKKKKNDRVQNQRHACLFCEELKSHIQDHYMRIHRDRVEVKSILNCENDKEREKMKDLLRAQGDHIHNKRVTESKSGELLLFRRPTEAFEHNKYGPCIVCKEWMLTSSIKKHLKTCKGDTSSCVKRTRYVTAMSEAIKGTAPEHAHDLLIKEVFTIMTSDTTGCVARNDELICMLGEHWLKSCIDNKKRRGYWASQYMRLMAKLLIYVRLMRNNDTLTMWDILRPGMFESLVSAALESALPEMDDIEQLQSPTNVIKLKYDLVRMCQFKSSKACQIYDRTGESKWKKDLKAAEGVLREISRWWKTRCLKLAKKVLLERKLIRKEQLPDPKDIQKLGEYLSTELKHVELDKETVTYETYKHIAELTQARLVTYNKRRSGEVEDITVQHYSRKLDVADLDEGLMGDISDTERHLLDTHDLIQTRGKMSSIVPVLIPQECKRVMDFIANGEVRSKLKINTSSYLFATSTSRVPIRAYNSLKKVCEACQLNRPQDITSTNMRKYMATMAQVMNLTDSEMQQMCRHLGHTTKVHLTHYRTMVPYIERVTLGKVLLMQDLNIQSKFVGKSLEDVEFIDIIQDKNSSEKSVSVEPVESTEAQQPGETEDAFQFNEDVDECMGDESDMEEDACDLHEKKKMTGKGKKKEKKRQRWTETEHEELKKYFSKHLDRKIVPRRADCLRAKQDSFKNGGELHKRTWHLIVKKISAMNHK